jgi:hypothetical protein
VGGGGAYALEDVEAGDEGGVREGSNLRELEADGVGERD